MRNVESRKHKLIFDIMIGVIAAGLLMLISAFGLEAGTPLKKGAAAVCLGFYLIYLGTLFLLSYLFPRKSYVLSGLMWVCEHFSSPKSRHMALFYFAIGFLVGLSALLIGLGIL